MNSMILKLASVSLAVGMLGFAGCKSSTSPSSPSSPVNSSGTTTQPTSPSGNGVATSGAGQPIPAQSATSAPAQLPPTPAPVVPTSPPPPPPPVVLTAPKGTSVHVSVTQTLAASKNEVGDGFSGVLSSSISAPNGGGVIFPRGTHVNGTVVASKGRGKFKGAGALGIELTSIGGISVSSSEYEKAEKGKGKRTGAMIGGGAGGGALIGGLAGGGKGALIGGLVGAGAGTAGAAFTGNKDVVIPSESNIAFTLTTALSRTMPPKPPADTASAPPVSQ